MSVVTRFAPSPTGFLHIGGARTALFSWLYARHHGGRFQLRIEDTDRARSTEEAVRAIIDGLCWLGIDWDGDVVFQSTRAARHREAAEQLLASGAAYHCYASVEELAAVREQAKASGRPFRYDGRWRDRPASEAPPGVAPVVRLRAPETGETRIRDLVQGEVTVANAQLDDMVLLRADGTPTYMLAVVVDDHDMGITHIIRGDDHLSNAFRQYQIYRAFGWTVPEFAHVPLIHGSDGAKLSKRHGALGVDAYRDLGYLPEALCNYLLRLGWSHGDDEIISREQAVQWFGLDAVGRSPARFDFAKLGSLNAVYMRSTEPGRLVDLVMEALPLHEGERISPHARTRLADGLAGLRERAKTIVELAQHARIYAIDAPLPISAAAAAVLTPAARDHLLRLRGMLATTVPWAADALESALRDWVESQGDPALRLRDVAQPLRAALTGATVSPPIFSVMQILGRDESLARLDFALETKQTMALNNRAAQSAGGT
jgi:glutamyl-tRNA synthetase